MNASPFAIVFACLLSVLLGVARASSAQPSAKSSTQVQALSFDALLDAFSQMPGLEARFVERKHLRLLKKPLVSRGHLYFTRPGYLLRRIEEPLASEVLITPDTLSLKDSSGKETIDLHSRPRVRFFVDSLVSLLAGDKEALRASYMIEFTMIRGTPDAWRLELTPKQTELAEIVRSVNVEGKQLSVKKIEVIDTSGDQTLTQIVRANPKRSFSATERKELFEMVDR